MLDQLHGFLPISRCEWDGPYPAHPDLQCIPVAGLDGTDDGLLGEGSDIVPIQFHQEVPMFEPPFLGQRAREDCIHDDRGGASEIDTVALWPRREPHSARGRGGGREGGEGGREGERGGGRGERERGKEGEREREREREGGREEEEGVQ